MTRRENMPILYINIMDGLPSDFAREAFLWAVERPGEDRYCYRAEKFAREADYIKSTWRVMMACHAWAVFKSGGRICEDDQARDLENFLLQRHANWRAGGNVHPKYCTHKRG